MISPGNSQFVAIDRFAQELRSLPESAFAGIRTVREFLRSHPVEPETLERYLCWDSRRYTRNLIDRTRFYELLAICWDVGQQSSIHNHHQQNCWMAAPVGRLRVQNYTAAFEDLASGTCRIALSDCVEMDPFNPAVVDPAHPVHRVLNPREFNRRAVSLHIYSLPFDRCLVYSEQGTCGEVKLEYTTQYGES